MITNSGVLIVCVLPVYVFLVPNRLLSKIITITRVTSALLATQKIIIVIRQKKKKETAVEHRLECAIKIIEEKLKSPKGDHG